MVIRLKQATIEYAPPLQPEEIAWFYPLTLRLWHLKDRSYLLRIALFVSTKNRRHPIVGIILLHLSNVTHDSVCTTWHPQTIKCWPTPQASWLRVGNSRAIVILGVTFEIQDTFDGVEGVADPSMRSFTAFSVTTFCWVVHKFHGEAKIWFNIIRHSLSA